MVLHVFILLVGFLFLVKGADWFVEGAAGIAKKLGIPQLVIGLTIVAMGTSMPEAAVSITAALNNNAGITIGNIVGSNILNILIILGITAVITNVAIQKSTLLYEIPFMIGITALLLVFGLTGSSITFIEGVVFLLLFIAFLVYLFIMSKKGDARGVDGTVHREIIDKKGQAVGVLGCGIDLIYPKENFQLFYDMYANQTVISEYPPGSEPLKWHFPERNRIISGLSDGILVTEARASPTRPLPSSSPKSASCC